jgi:hypothetical protein
VKLHSEAIGLYDQFMAKFGRDAITSDVERFMFHEVAVLGAQVKEIETTRRTRAEEGSVTRPPIAEIFAQMREFVEHDGEVLALLAECGDVQGTDPIRNVEEAVVRECDIRFLAEQSHAGEMTK